MTARIDTSPEAMEKMLDGVTAGPWHAAGPPWNQIIYSSSENRIAFAAHSNGLDDDRDIATARFIAWSREAVPTLAARVAELEAQVAKLVEDAAFIQEQRASAMLRRNLNAPEDAHVHTLCERHGYGAVMDAASRLWARKDSMGAFYVGGCIGMKSDDEARAQLAEAKAAQAMVLDRAVGVDPLAAPDTAAIRGALLSLPAVYAHQINTGVREVYDPLQRFYRMEDVLHALIPKRTADDRA